MQVGQIAFSVADLETTISFYQACFGFADTGKTHLFRGPIAENIQGLPQAASICQWLVDGQDDFQLGMVDSREELEAAITESQMLRLGLIIPPDFDQRVGYGTIPVIQDAPHNNDPFPDRFTVNYSILCQVVV